MNRDERHAIAADLAERDIAARRAQPESLRATVEVVEAGKHGPEAVHVRVPTGRGRSRVLAAPVLVEIGDTFRDRRESWRTLTVRSFYGDGTMAFVDRNSSRRKQAVSVVRLVTDYNR